MKWSHICERSRVFCRYTSSVAEKGLKNQFAREGPSRAKYTGVMELLCISFTTVAKLLCLFYYQTSCQKSVKLGEYWVEDRGVRRVGYASNCGPWVKYEVL